MPQQQVIANFTKGLNERIHIERGEEDRLHRLQNARLQERGETLQVSRIDGYQYIDNSPTTFDVVYDSLFYQNDLVVYWYDTTAGEVHITFIDINDGSEIDLSFAATQVPYGEIELIEDNIYLTPYDKQINLVDGTWRINDFISTTPTFDLERDTDSNGMGQIFFEGEVITSGFCNIDIDGTTTDTRIFSSGTTGEEIAEVMFNELLETTLVQDYNFELNGDQITIIGPNATILVNSDYTGVSNTINDVTGAGPGNLEPNTYYWYKLRFVYNDGHKTITSYPQFIETAPSSLNARIFNINIQEDLDGNLVDIEIFRKKEAEDWFLIERVTPSSTFYTYVDDGKSNIQPLDERNYVWARNPKNQEIVRDRLVRANLEYEDKFLGWEEGEITFSKNTSFAALTDDGRLPKNTEIEIFGQGRYNDGTVTPHVQLGKIDIGDEEVTFATDPQNQPSNVEDLNEVAYFGKINSKQPNNISFNSLEIYNNNVPSLATKFKPEAEQDKPLNPHIFLGYKYLRVYVESGSLITNVEVYDQDWNYDGTNYVGTDDSVDFADDNWTNTVSVISSNVGNDTLTITLDGTNGNNLGPLTYKKKFESQDDTTYDAQYIYELAIVEPLKKAISENKVSLRLNSLTTTGPLSSSLPNSDFINNEVSITGMLDTSSSQRAAYDSGGGFLVNTGKNHVYLVLDSDSIYSEYNNIDLNNDGVLANYDVGELPDLQSVFNFEIIGIQEKNFGGTTTTDDYPEDSSITEFFVDYGLSEFSPVSENQDQAFFIGVQKEFDEDNLTTYVQNFFDGYTFNKEDLFEYQTQLEGTIFESLITEEDLNQFQENYPNQLVWGGPHILESNASGIRDFEFTNFKNISEEYGEIVKISYINNVLLVFCERGVNMINIGEVLTQQASGQTFVDSSRLLNNDIWILKNIPDIKPRSVEQYENLLFFCDGKDVWKYDSAPQNITNGRITLDPESNYIGHIDPKNKEYLLSDGVQTYSYAIELDEWQGPYSFAPDTSSTYRDNFYGVIDENATKFNIGNTFGGTDYGTVIESVANIANAPQITKLFRKFYIETEGDGTFSYAKNYGDWTDKVLSNYPNKNGLIHIGVNPANKNGRQIYWKIVSNIQDFILQQVSWIYESRKRR